jgi:hypothetical protein
MASQRRRKFSLFKVKETKFFQKTWFIKHGKKPRFFKKRGFSVLKYKLLIFKSNSTFKP